MTNGFAERMSAQASTAPPGKAAVCDYRSSKVLRGEQVLPLKMLYKGITHFIFNHVPFLIQSYDTTKGRCVFVCRHMNMQMQWQREKEPLRET